MKNLQKYFEQAKLGGWNLWKLNFILGFGIPFNKPHGIKIVHFGDNEVRTIIPYKRANFNHIKGIHACGLATAAEFASGLLLLSKLNPAKYRIIMQSFEVVYHYQAKKDVVASFTLSDDAINDQIITPLKTSDLCYIKCQINLHDLDKNHVATAYTNWQIKLWDRVKTKA